MIAMLTTARAYLSNMTLSGDQTSRRSSLENNDCFRAI